jgi:hypothetical protein
MKIRSGFVSNSSTSSFCVLGIFLNKEKFLENIKKISESKLEVFAISEYNYNRSHMEVWLDATESSFKGYDLSDDVLVGIDVDGKAFLDLLPIHDKIVSLFSSEPSVYGWGYYDG